MLSLGQRRGVERLEAACARALKHSAVSWKSGQAILKNGLDLQPQGVQRALDLPEQADSTDRRDLAIRYNPRSRTCPSITG